MVDIPYKSMFCIHGGAMFLVCDWMMVSATEKNFVPPMHRNFSNILN